MTTIDILVGYEPAQIRRLAIKCPKCDKWFHSVDVSDVEFLYSSDLEDWAVRISRKQDYDDFRCPNCNYNPCVDNDKIKVAIKETSEFPEYAKKKVTWD